MEILQDDLSGSAVRRLVGAHLTNMPAVTPAESVHALGIEALQRPEITFWSLWEERVLLGCGAFGERCGPFAGYAEDPNRVFMTLRLRPS